LKHFKDIQNLSEFYSVDIKHPLISIHKYEDTRHENLIKNEPISFDFYKISFVKNFNGFIQIGNTRFEGENGILHFVEPKQVYTCNSTNPWKGYELLIHSDIFNKHFAHKKISAYDFFSYEVNETLLLAKEEEKIVSNLLEMTWDEFYNNKDTFSIPIILSYISTLLNLTERFYARQFKTRKTLNNKLSSDFFDLLKNYYLQNEGIEIQQPTVQYFSDQLGVTPNYLSDTIRHHSEKSALTIIHDYIVEEAKKQLQFSNKTVSEISYQLGFEYPNYFSRLFKKKTSQTPSEYRESVKSI
jgi:AraC family transcriptional regulator, transcriptional activator of pobA